MLYDYLYRQVFSNRWLAWFVVIAICVAIGLLGYIQHAFVELEGLFPEPPIVSRHSHLPIRITNLQAYQVVKSPFRIKGEARGFWFFEGDFPVKLLDENGNIIEIAIAKGGGAWMTNDFVAFQAYLEFSVPETIYGTVVFEKDNPSGLPEHDREFRVPVILTPD